MNEGIINFGQLCGFNMSVKCLDDIAVPEYAVGHHIHPECEIYVHLGGDVSFMVEDRIYPIQYGNVVITRPYEYHHCIYHKTTKHRHIWILFSGDGNEGLLDMFFGRQKGTGNILSLNADQTLEMTRVCKELCRSPQSKTEKYYLFFKMLHIMNNAEEVEKDRVGVQDELSPILRMIHKNYAEKLTVKSLAKEGHISISTLERRFAEALDMTPSEYIKRVRLKNVARLLSDQLSVTEAAEKSGFSDTSAMIGLFKQQYGMTPLQYKKHNANK